MSETVTADKFRTVNCTEAPFRLKKDSENSKRGVAVS